jgi:hypothetical protein
MAELGIAADNDAIAAHYASFADAMLYDSGDSAPGGLPASATATLMLNLDDKIRVAKAALSLAVDCRAE